MSDSGLTRRRVLAATVSLSAVSLAGCLGNGDDETNDGSGEDGDTQGEDGDTQGEDAGTDASDGGFTVEGDGELPTDPAPEDFVDMTGHDEVEVVTVWREDHSPEFVFDPPFVRVDAGATVRWVNDDGVFHTVTSTDSLENRSQSGLFNETIASDGDTFEWETDDTGVQHYYCTPHAAFMYGSVEVV